MFGLKLLLILNFTTAVSSNTPFRAIFQEYKKTYWKEPRVKYGQKSKGKQTPTPLSSKEIHRLGPMNLKIYSLERNPRLWLGSWQSLETFAKIISVTSISGLFRQLYLTTNISS